MSPKFYSVLWIAFFASAVGFVFTGNFSMLTATVYGFGAFGLTFIGMMCVLPGLTHQPVHESVAPPISSNAATVNMKPEKVTAGMPVYRSV